jgi:hypothetical protein
MATLGFGMSRTSFRTARCYSPNSSGIHEASRRNFYCVPAVDPPDGYILSATSTEMICSRRFDGGYGARPPDP